MYINTVYQVYKLYTLKIMYSKCCDLKVKWYFFISQPLTNIPQKYIEQFKYLQLGVLSAICNVKVMKTSWFVVAGGMRPDETV